MHWMFQRQIQIGDEGNMLWVMYGFYLLQMKKENRNSGIAT